MSLEALTCALRSLAPLELAEPWDNVGWLLPGREGRGLARALLTIDLTDAVLDEAAELQVDAIVAYHPLMFEGKKRLRREVASERVVLRAIEAGLPVFSPHTALDAAPGGLTDWLADAIGFGDRSPIVRSALHAGAGQGRVTALAQPASLESIVPRVKAHLGITSLRVACAARHGAGARIETAAVVAGAGGSVLAKASADLWLTGELRHHDVLAAVEAGTTVLLAEHTGSERGYLPILAERLRDVAASAFEVLVSERDRDPVSPTS